jgi:uncharacterized protein
VAAYFLESSALLKRYVHEVGTDYVVGLTAPAAGHALHVSRLSQVELVAAIARRRKGKTIRAKVASMLLDRVRDDFSGLFRIVEVSPEVLGHAEALADRHAIRAYDAVQLAAALAVAANLADAGLSLTFVSSDRELNAAAGAEGLSVVEPTAESGTPSSPSTN